MRKYLVSASLFISAFLCLSFSTPSYAQTCEDLVGYDTGAIACLTSTAVPSGWSQHPDGPTGPYQCLDDPLTLSCYVDSIWLCGSGANPGTTCVTTSVDCPGGAAENSLICAWGSRCCDPSPAVDCNTVIYQECRGLQSCTGLDGFGIPANSGDYTCPTASQQCCVHLCEPNEFEVLQGVDYYCDTDRHDPDDNVVSQRYCSSGNTCYSTEPQSGFDCVAQGGRCVNVATPCNTATEHLDMQGHCGNSALSCCMANPEVTCVQTGDECVASADPCPSGKDKTTARYCGPFESCCQERSPCDPLAAGSSCTMQAGGYFDCPNCNSEGCSGNTRCAPTSQPGVYACVPCTIDTACTGPGICNEAGGCNIGERCMDLGAGNYRCQLDQLCGLSVIRVNPYTGPILSFNNLLLRIYAFMYPAGIALGLVFIAKAGYTIMMSEGNPTKISEGKDELTAAVLGTLFILLSLVILRVIIRALLGAQI